MARAAVPPLRIARLPSGDLALRRSPQRGVTFEIHRGTIAALRTGGDHEPIACDVAAPSLVSPLPASDSYFLVGSRCGTERSTLGRDSLGRARAPGATPCP